VSPVTQLDWPAALAEFVLNIGSDRRGVVYLDPPYSKLQYSRYYHVLNSILSYDYPPVEGAGRTPPREMRFSSKFEYQPVTARKEFDALFKACAMNRLSIVASYSDTGFVTIDELLRMMAAYYGRVDVFAERMRHHSQGVRLNGRQGNVTEYVLVARY
jgi:adenine-specific DNA-methyltransferase